MTFLASNLLIMKKFDRDFMDALSSHQPYIATIIYNKCKASFADAEDIKQNVILSLWEKRSKFTHLTSNNQIDLKQFKKWAARFTHNHVVWFFSKKKRKDGKIDFDSEKFDVISEVIGEEDPALANRAEEESKKKFFYQCCAVLTPQEKDIFGLLWKGMNTSEVGHILNVSHQRISQKMEKIRTKINKNFDSSSRDCVNKNVLEVPEYLKIAKDFLDTEADSKRDAVIHII